MPEAPPTVEALDLRAEVKRLLEFAVSRAEIKIESTLIQRAVKASAVGDALTPEQEAELWESYNALAGQIRPATPESVRAITELISDQTRRPGIVRWWFNDVPARKQIVCAILWIIIAIVPLVMLQIYSLSLTSVLANITQADAKYTELSERLRFLDQSLAAGPKEPESLKAQRDAVDTQVTYYESVTTASYGMLIKLTGFWVKHISGDAPVLGGSAEAKAGQFVALQINARNASEAFLKAISLYLLPLLYGLLGANVYVLRSVIQHLDTWSLKILSGSKHQLRRALGALLGATLGLLFDTNESIIATTGFGLAMLSFLAGYSAEFVFSLFDTAIDRAKEVFVAKKDLATEAAKAQAE